MTLLNLFMAQESPEAMPDIRKIGNFFFMFSLYGHCDQEVPFARSASWP
jgi:hypothetical protein